METPSSFTLYIYILPQKGAFYKQINGAGDKTRTYDPLITNEMLYQLSYTGIRPYNNGQENEFQGVLLTAFDFS